MDDVVGIIHYNSAYDCNICPRCGYPVAAFDDCGQIINDEELRFCYYCGTKLKREQLRFKGGFE